MNEATQTPFPRPLDGSAVEAAPSGLVPPRIPLQGRHVRLEPMDPARHTGDLYAASHTADKGPEIWTYLPEGPWPNRDAYRRSLVASAGSLERVFYAIRPLPDGPASGQASFMAIQPAYGVIEIGYIWFAPSLQ